MGDVDDVDDGKLYVRMMDDGWHSMIVVVGCKPRDEDIWRRGTNIEY